MIFKEIAYMECVGVICHYFEIEERVSRLHRHSHGNA